MHARPISKLPDGALMKIEVLREPFARDSYTISYSEQSLFTEVYGFAGQAGRIYLEGQLLRRTDTPANSILLFMHPSSSLSLLPLPTALADSGIHVMCCGSRYLRNDTPLIMEKVLLDMGAHIAFARDEIAYKNVILAGWSGGGSLSIYYQAQAEQPTVRSTPAGDPVDLSVAGLQPADGILSIAAHLSRAETLTEWLDPSVKDESDPATRDPEFDIYARETTHTPPFDAAFVERFRAAQIARNRRITAWAEQQLARLADANDGTVEHPFIVHRTMCDPRWIDPSIDPNEREPDSCYLGDPRVVNSGPAGLARFTTLRAWLSQWSFNKSRARTADNAPTISVPALVIENGADNATPASHPRKIFDLLGSADKRFERIDGATHYYREQPGHQAHVVSLLTDWMREHGQL